MTNKLHYGRLPDPALEEVRAELPKKVFSLAWHCLTLRKNRLDMITTTMCRRMIRQSMLRRIHFAKQENSETTETGVGGQLWHPADRAGWCAICHWNRHCRRISALYRREKPARANGENVAGVHSAECIQILADYIAASPDRVEILCRWLKPTAKKIISVFQV